MHPNLSDAINLAIQQSEQDGGIWLDKVESGKRIVVKTRNTVYTIDKLVSNDYLIWGHKIYCPFPMKAGIVGSTWGVSTLKIGFLGINMHMEFNTEMYSVVTTTEIKSIAVI